MQAALTTLRQAGYSVKAWNSADVEAVLEMFPGASRLSDSRKERVIESVLESYEFQSLEEATDRYWENIHQAVQNALHSVA